MRDWVCAVLVGAGAVALSVPVCATTPGPTHVLRCPGSKELRQAPSIGSGNTIGATFWSDGFMLAPMLPQFPAITRCTADGPLFWVSSAKVLGTLSGWGDEQRAAPAAWLKAPVVRPLTEQELLQAIAQGLGDTPSRLAYLRLQAWWAFNHALRSQGQPGAPTARSLFPAGSAARSNLEALVAAQDETDMEQLLNKAEGLRELARFDEAERLLKNAKLDDPDLQHMAALIRQRIALRDARVVVVNAPR